MGMRRDASIEAWQERTGIEPATGERARILEELSQAAFELIKAIELERSGIRDGDGYWSGSCPPESMVSRIGELRMQYNLMLRRGSRTDTRWMRADPESAMARSDARPAHR